MDHVNAAVRDRKIVLFLMPAKGTEPTGSLVLTVEQAKELSRRLFNCVWEVENSPLSGAEAVAESTGTSPDQLRFGGLL